MGANNKLDVLKIDNYEEEIRQGLMLAHLSISTDR